jgi:hypothetical protein
MEAPARPRAVLRFAFQLAAPDSKAAFARRGGRLDAATAPLFSSFHVSGNAVALRALADQAGDTEKPHDLVIALDAAEVEDDGTVVLPSTTRLCASFMSRAFTLNGTIGASVLGEQNVLLTKVLSSGGNALVPLLYDSTWGDARAHVAIFGARVGVVDPGHSDVAARPARRIEFRSSAALMAAVGRLESNLRLTVAAANKLRMNHLRYAKQAALTKCVSAAVGGFAGSGYVPLASMLDHGVSISLEGLEAALDFALRLELGDDDAALAEARAEVLSDDLERVGALAVEFGSCLSTIVASLMSYRVDGAPVITPQGASFTVSEKWTRSAPAAGLEADDCDRSATMLLNTALAAQRASPEARARLPNVGALGALLDHYTPTLTVLGARAAEASGDHAHSRKIAGHAVSLLIPNQQLVDAVTRGAARPGSAVGAAGAAAYAERLWCCLYPPETVARLPEAIAAQLSRPFAEQPASALPPLALEGTTPSSALVYDHNAQVRAELHRHARRQKEAGAVVGQSAGRALKTLAALGESEDTHGFYDAFVEATLATTHPMWSDVELRRLGGGATQQLVFASPQRDGMASAGASPRELATGNFALVPLAPAPQQRALDFDALAEVAARDVFPPATTSPRLSKETSAQLAATRAALEALSVSDVASRGTSTPVTYVLSTNALLFNPEYVAKTIDKYARHPRSVLLRDVPGLVSDSEGKDVGFMAAVIVSL